MNPILSHIIAGRNDNYLGNFKYRLEMAVNYTCDNVAKSGNLDSYELLIVDWNSETPLRAALNLGEAALRCVSFLEATPDIVRAAGLGGMPFNMATSINVGLRRAGGRHVMFTPSDVFFPYSSIASLFSLLRGDVACPLDLDRGYFGIARFLIPWQASERLGLENIDTYIACHTPYLALEGNENSRACSEGGFFISREVCHRVRGYDEKYTHWGHNDAEFGYRLAQIVPIHKSLFAGIFNYDLQQSDLQRKEGIAVLNKVRGPYNLVANDENWGLGQYAIERAPAIRTTGIDNTPRERDAAEMFAYDPATVRKIRLMRKLFRKILKHGIGKKRMKFFTSLTGTRLAKKKRRLWVSFCLLACEVAMSHLPGLNDSKGDWFAADPDERNYFISLYRKLLITTTPIPQEEEMIFSLLAIILTLRRQNPSACIFAPSREYFPMGVATLLNPTLQVVSCDDSMDYDMPTFPIPDNNFFHGLCHVMTGPLDSAFRRIAAVPGLPEKYQYAFLDVDFLKKTLDTLVDDLLPLLDDGCCVLLRGVDENREAIASRLPEAGFRQVGVLPGVTAFARERRA